MEELNGTVTSIIYRNEENGYTVLELSQEDGGEIAAVGCMPLATPGERVSLIGDFTEHREYGVQFKVQKYSTLTPNTLTGLEKYLAALIKGVGEVTARNIVAAFGEDTLFIMQSHPERLSEVEGIGINRAQVIAQSFEEQRAMRDVMLALQEYGITVNQAVKLYKLYGDDCIGIVRENPYQLIEVHNIGFKTADKIAQSVGIEHDSTFRLSAGLQYVLSWAQNEGHTHLPVPKLVELAAQMLEVDGERLGEVLDELLMRSSLAAEKTDDYTGVFLPYMLKQERAVAKRLLTLGQNKFTQHFIDIESELASLEQESHATLAGKQREAVLTAMSAGAMVITGGPGTGKTTIISFILKLFTKLGISFELCAPTGRAAKRITETTGHEARTIHRLLESSYNEGFSKNEDNPVVTDAVILDEASMVDVFLMHSLLRALGDDTRLIIVGDVDQLPSVGAGNVLSDIIKSDVLPVIRLTEIYRQATRSMIIVNAHRVNHGEVPLISPESDFTFEEPYSAAQMLERVVRLCSGDPMFRAFDPIKDIQVLSPMKKGELGVLNLNTQLQRALNPPAPGKAEKHFGNLIFREGDKVMQIRNNYQLEWMKEHSAGVELGKGCYNGDLGTIMRIDTEAQTLDVLFDDERLTHYEFSQLDELDLAYCISIHKSQGSEFPVVVLPLAGGPPILMTRNLLYTAITRARKHVHIVGRGSAVHRMVRNAQLKRRYSALAVFIAELRGFFDEGV